MTPLPQDQLPAFVYGLDGLSSHVAGIRAALAGVELFYAAKANPDAPILRTVAARVDGIEVASGGELAHVRAVLPSARVAFGGPGKTDDELRAALDLGVERIHVESPHELRRLASFGREADVLLRVNLAGDRRGAALAMSGPFGMDPEAIGTCTDILAAAPWLRLRGVHAHLASGLHSAAMADQTAEILAWARPWLAEQSVASPEYNVGGGMAVDYGRPDLLFDWADYARRIVSLKRPGETLRVEPGRAVTVYHGHYVTDVLDVKHAHGDAFAVLRGGTHHLRTPVTRQHDQPFHIVGTGSPDAPALTGEEVTLVGQLCTPKDVFARRQKIPRIAVGDQVVFEMAGAYAWNISHHDFLMHPKPTFHYLGTSLTGM